MAASEAIKLERERRTTLREQKMWEMIQRPEVIGVLSVLGGMVLCQNLKAAGILTKDQAGIAAGAVVTIAVYRAAGGGIGGTVAGLGAGGISAASIGEEWPTVAGIGGGAAVGTAALGFPIGTAVGALVGGVAGALTD